MGASIDFVQNVVHMAITGGEGKTVMLGAQHFLFIFQLPIPMASKQTAMAAAERKQDVMQTQLSSTLQVWP